MKLEQLVALIKAKQEEQVPTEADLEVLASYIKSRVEQGQSVMAMPLSDVRDHVLSMGVAPNRTNMLFQTFGTRMRAAGIRVDVVLDNPQFVGGSGHMSIHI